MIQPDELKRPDPLVWSTGRGTDVWDMFCACIAGDLETVRRLLSDDPSLVRGAYAYRRPMYFAVRENRIDIARLLLAHGADPSNAWGDDTLLDIARDRGHTEMLALLETTLAARYHVSSRLDAIVAAIKERDLARVRELLDASPELLHAADVLGNQPIHWAVMTRQLEMIDDLLARGADINAQRPDGARPIQLTNGDYTYRGWRDVPAGTDATPRQVLQHLRDRGAFCDICTAAHVGDLDRVRALLDSDSSLANRPSEYVSYYACSGTPLKNAAGNGHLAIVRLLLEHGADPNLPEEEIAPRGHALHAAACNGHLDVVRLLLEHGAYPNVEIESSADTLCAAISRGDQPMIDLLCSYGAASAMHLLAHYGDIRTAAAVLAANPALADDPQALDSAAGQGHESFVRLMLHYQPDLPRRVGTRAKTRPLNELLFAHGMNPSHPDWLLVTPLHRLAQSGDLETAALFLDHGADLYARDEHLGSTPLAWAAKYGKALMVRLLLRRGAPVKLADDPSWATPLAWATRRGHAEIVRLLQQFETDGTLPNPTLEPYEATATDLVAACRSGDAAARQRLADLFHLTPVPSADEIRGRVRTLLNRYAPTRPDRLAADDLGLEDARLLVARINGFETWPQLTTHIDALSL